MGKLSFIAGAAAGYVVGARAGTRRYEQIKTQASKLWSSDPVQEKVGKASEAAKTKAAPFVADVVGDAAKTTANKLRDVRGGHNSGDKTSDTSSGDDLPSGIYRDESGGLQTEPIAGPKPGQLP